MDPARDPRRERRPHDPRRGADRQPGRRHGADAADARDLERDAGAPRARGRPARSARQHSRGQRLPAAHVRPVRLSGAVRRLQRRSGALRAAPGDGTAAAGRDPGLPRRGRGTRAGGACGRGFSPCGAPKARPLRTRDPFPAPHPFRPGAPCSPSSGPPRPVERGALGARPPAGGSLGIREADEAGVRLRGGGHRSPRRRGRLASLRPSCAVRGVARACGRGRWPWRACGASRRIRARPSGSRQPGPSARDTRPGSARDRSSGDA